MKAPDGSVTQYRREQRAALARRTQVVRFQLVHQRVFEFVVAADMVRMRVCRDSGHLLLQQMLRGLAQARDAHTGVDHQIAVAAANVPDIAAHERHDVRLP